MNNNLSNQTSSSAASFLFTSMLAILAALFVFFSAQHHKQDFKDSFNNLSSIVAVSSQADFIKAKPGQKLLADIKLAPKAVSENSVMFQKNCAWWSYKKENEVKDSGAATLQNSTYTITPNNTKVWQQLGLKQEKLQKDGADYDTLCLPAGNLKAFAHVDATMMFVPDKVAPANFNLKQKTNDAQKANNSTGQKTGVALFLFVLAALSFGRFLFLLKKA